PPPELVKPSGTASDATSSLSAISARSARARSRSSCGACAADVESSDTRARREQATRADDSEAPRRVGDPLPAECDSQGRGGRIAAYGKASIDERAQRPRQHALARGQRAVPFDGEIPPRHSRTPAQAAHEIGL